MAIVDTDWTEGNVTLIQGTEVQLVSVAQSPFLLNQLVERSLSTIRTLAQVELYSLLACTVTPVS